ncbi:MAG: GNAT family protein [Pseudomonas oryzihabitans]
MTPLAWTPARVPHARQLQGHHVRLESLDPARHGADLWQALHEQDPTLWDYLPYGPFSERAAFDAWLAGLAQGHDPLFFVVVDPRDGRALGQLSLMSIVPEHGSIEIGHVAFGGRLQRTPLATEAFHLLMREAFALGYRRLEWKCDDANARSKRAAERLGLSYEGLFRQHRVVKGRNRDTAWFSLLDREWPAVDAGFQRWLAADNFDADGRQRQPLAVMSGK